MRGRESKQECHSDRDDQPDKQSLTHGVSTSTLALWFSVSQTVQVCTVVQRRQRHRYGCADGCTDDQGHCPPV